MDTIRLNLGSGDKPLDGFENLDIKTGADDVRTLPYADRSVREIRAIHILEHFPFKQTVNVLREWVRVLEPGGEIKVSVPDFDWIIQAYVEGTNTAPEALLMGGQVDPYDFHLAIFNHSKLLSVMELAGLTEVEKWSDDVKDTAKHACSLNLRGVRRADGDEPKAEIGETQEPVDPVCVHFEPETVKKFDDEPVKPPVKTAALMTLPRLTHTDTMFAVGDAMTALRIPTLRASGVFWFQELTKLVLAAIEQMHAEYVITVDYDTVFTPLDVCELYRLMKDSDADAICATQMARARASALFSILDDEGHRKPYLNVAELETDLLPVTSGHFGLTLLKTESFKKVAKPWFLSHPDPDGNWGDHRRDADVNFWFKWRDAGNTAYMACRVPVGHIQTVIAWPGRDLRPCFQYLSDYSRIGKPKGILGGVE